MRGCAFGSEARRRAESKDRELKAALVAENVNASPLLEEGEQDPAPPSKLETTNPALSEPDDVGQSSVAAPVSSVQPALPSAVPGESAPLGAQTLEPSATVPSASDVASPASSTSESSSPRRLLVHPSIEG